MSTYGYTSNELVELLGHYTTVTLEKTSLQGYLYTIDPNTNNVVLYTDQQTIQVIMNHCIHQVTSKLINKNSMHFIHLFYSFQTVVDKERKLDIELIDNALHYQSENCIYTSKDALDKRRRDLIQHLETVIQYLSIYIYIYKYIHMDNSFFLI
jgi:hypothetical protein